MVTAEFAVALPAVVVTAVTAVTFLSLVSAQLRTLDAAAVAARLVARGETSAAVAKSVAAVAPGARLQVQAAAATDPLVMTEVTTSVHVAVFGRLLPSFTVRERASAARESGVP
jgi:hypothetical protein